MAPTLVLFTMLLIVIHINFSGGLDAFGINSVCSALCN